MKCSSLIILTQSMEALHVTRSQLGPCETLNTHSCWATQLAVTVPVNKTLRQSLRILWVQTHFKLNQQCPPLLAKRFCTPGNLVAMVMISSTSLHRGNRGKVYWNWTMGRFTCARGRPAATPPQPSTGGQYGHWCQLSQDVPCPDSQWKRCSPGGQTW